jgi:hypothetical protein
VWAFFEEENDKSTGTTVAGMVNNTTDNFATSSNTVLRFEAIKQYV